MKHPFVTVAAAALLVTLPAMVQPSQSAPARVRDDQVAAMQQKLNDDGFDAGQVDGMWGPNTSGALRRYQAKNGLQQTGQLDPKTSKSLSSGITAATASASPVQGTTPHVPPVTVPPAAVVTPATHTPVVQSANGGAATASGNTNQAVATTAANAPQPATGANSFTAAEARGRIEHEGYTRVADLRKDGNGVWRGRAMKDGASVGIWLDYKGNVGQQ